MNLAQRIDGLNWQQIGQQLQEQGYANIPALLSEVVCKKISAMYDDRPAYFRKTIDMDRYHFGQGQYKYFGYPLPDEVQTLRKTFYPHLAGLANVWYSRLKRAGTWPRTLDEFTQQCHAENQFRPTPLLLRYRESDYNCLHQDLYGAVYFPLQVIVLLSSPGGEFDGGELILVEQRPRMQSRPMVVPLQQGDAVIIPVRELPRQGIKGFYQAQMRHGVSRITRGSRTALGLIFHDAA